MMFRTLWVSVSLHLKHLLSSPWVEEAFHIGNSVTVVPQYCNSFMVSAEQLHFEVSQSDF